MSLVHAGEAGALGWSGLGCGTHSVVLRDNLPGLKNGIFTELALLDAADRN